MRLFTAVELPRRLTDAFERIQQGVPGAKWVPPENMHITLTFLGEVDGGQAEDLTGELGRIDRPSFELAPAGVGHFSGGAGIKTLWMGLKPEAPLLALQKDVARACRRAGLPPDRRTFRPHITLARFNYPPDLDRARRFLERYARFERPPFRVSGFSLFSSELRSKGAIYRIEADFPFSDAGIGESPFFGDWDAAARAKQVRTK